MQSLRIPHPISFLLLHKTVSKTFNSMFEWLSRFILLPIRYHICLKFNSIYIVVGRMVGLVRFGSDVGRMNGQLDGRMVWVCISIARQKWNKIKNIIQFFDHSRFALILNWINFWLKMARLFQFISSSSLVFSRVLFIIFVVLYLLVYLTPYLHHHTTITVHSIKPSLYHPSV